jgi:hypothetical protein
MIVVRANLYREHAEHARRERPKVRLRNAAAALIIALFIWDFTQSRAVSGLREQLAASQRLSLQLAADIEKAAAADVELQGGTARRDAILKFASQRRNWAPLLASAFAALPPTVELSTVQVEADDLGKPRVLFTGRSAGAEPRLEADKCMLQIRHALAAAGAPMAGRFIALEDVRSTLIGAGNPHGYADFTMQFTETGGADAN